QQPWDDRDIYGSKEFEVVGSCPVAKATRRLLVVKVYSLLVVCLWGNVVKVAAAGKSPVWAGEGVDNPIHGPDRASRSACGRDKSSVVGEKGRKREGRER